MPYITMHFIISSDYQSLVLRVRVVILLTSKSRGDMEEPIMGLCVVVVSESSICTKHAKMLDSFYKLSIHVL